MIFHDLGARWDGGARTVKDALPIPDVSTEHVIDHGNATVRKVGVECYAMKVRIIVY